MAQQSTYPLKRRFEVHLPKRHRGTDPDEPQQQNPLQTWLGKRKAAAGLHTLLAEARAESAPSASHRVGALALPDSIPAGETVQGAWQSFDAEQNRAAVSNKPSGFKTVESEEQNGAGCKSVWKAGQGARKSPAKQLVGEAKSLKKFQSSPVNKPGTPKKKRKKQSISEAVQKEAGNKREIPSKKKKLSPSEERWKKKNSDKGGATGNQSRSQPQTGSPKPSTDKPKPPDPGAANASTAEKPGVPTRSNEGTDETHLRSVQEPLTSKSGNGRAGMGGNPNRNTGFAGGGVPPQGEPQKAPRKSLWDDPPQAPGTVQIGQSPATGFCFPSFPPDRGGLSAYAPGFALKVPGRGGVNAFSARGGVNAFPAEAQGRGSVNASPTGAPGRGGSNAVSSGAPQRGGANSLSHDAPSERGANVYQAGGPDRGGVNTFSHGAAPQGGMNTSPFGAPRSGDVNAFQHEAHAGAGANAFRAGGGVNAVPAGSASWQDMRLSMQAQECQRLWEALQGSLNTWNSVLLQRDADASQRSAKLALQTAASKKAREDASAMLAEARQLKQEAEEIREAALQERRRAAAELEEARHERAAIERAKQELETRREELATEAMELNQKRRLYEQTLAQLDAEKSAAELREHPAEATTRPNLSAGRPPSSPNPPNPGGAPPSEEHLPPPAGLRDEPADASNSPADVSTPHHDVSMRGDPEFAARRPTLGVISGLMIEREEGSGSPSPLGLYRGFTPLKGVKVETVDLSEEEDGVNAPSKREEEQEHFTGDIAAPMVADWERGGALTAKMDPPEPGAKHEAVSDDEDLPLSFRSGRRKRERGADLGTDSTLGRGGVGKESHRLVGGEAVNLLNSGAAHLLSEVKAELAGGPRPGSKSVHCDQHTGPSPGTDPKVGLHNPHFPGVGPLGRYPSTAVETTPSSKRELIHTAGGGSASALAGSGMAKKPKRKRTAVEVLRKDAPELLESLTQAGMLDDMKLYGEEFEGEEEAAGSASFRALQAILDKIYDATPSKNGHSWNTSGNLGSSHLPKYCMGALKVLTDEAKRLRKGGRPVEWGWCHRLHAFLFVFEEQNRFVLEWPHYGNATYFFNLESRDVDFQLQRLIAVMSIGTVTKNDIVEDRPLELIKGIPPDELRVLEDFGRKRETGLGSFLNFANRVVHDYKDECTLEQWQTRIRSELHRGRNTGQIDKSPGRPLSWPGLGEVAPLALGGALPVSQEELLAVKAEQIEELGPPSGL